mgnify:CR=1 FL=1
MAQTVEDLERQIEQLKARKRALVQKENQRNRKRRNHALMTAGALVESCFDDGWTEIGYGRLAAYLKRHKEEIVAEFQSVERSSQRSGACSGRAISECRTPCFRV